MWHDLIWYAHAPTVGVHTSGLTYTDVVADIRQRIAFDLIHPVEAVVLDIRL